jgi:uncharacterized protein (DUF427 family)
MTTTWPVVSLSFAHPAKAQGRHSDVDHDSTRATRPGPGGWRYHGQARPPFAVEPGAGQESVWDYPRPPRIDPEPREVLVTVGEVEIARTRRARRVLETASPPTVYIPPTDLRTEHLRPAPGASTCEWKGRARYWTVHVGAVVLDAVAWSYDEPLPAFDAIRGHLCFYPSRIACFVDGVQVAPQDGGFYGGWVTPEIVGPFKGAPGTGGW